MSSYPKNNSNEIPRSETDITSPLPDMVNQNDQQMDHALQSTPARKREPQQSSECSIDCERNINNAVDDSRTMKSSAPASPLASGEKVQSGNRGDSRMHKAVAYRMSNPSASLLEALEQGGFKFPSKFCNTATDRNTLDEDGVQLSQRKNQLGRRLRQIRKNSNKNEGRRPSNQNYISRVPPDVSSAVSAGYDFQQNPAIVECLLRGQAQQWHKKQTTLQAENDLYLMRGQKRSSAFASNQPVKIKGESYKIHQSQWEDGNMLLSQNALLALRSPGIHNAGISPVNLPQGNGNNLLSAIGDLKMSNANCVYPSLSAPALSSTLLPITGEETGRRHQAPILNISTGNLNGNQFAGNDLNVSEKRACMSSSYFMAFDSQLNLAVEIYNNGHQQFVCECLTAVGLSQNLASDPTIHLLFKNKLNGRWVP